MSEEEKYILKNTHTNLYLKGYKGGKPLWTEKENEAAVYSEMDGLRMQRHLKIYKIVMVEKS